MSCPNLDFILEAYIALLPEPVTSVIPTQDNQTMLVTTLDSRVRLMDTTSGKMLNEFVGHTNEAYRCRACFGHGEATVICGDEKGMVWAWDLLDVSYITSKPLLDTPYIRLTGQSFATQSTTESTSEGYYMDRAPPHRR